MYKWYALETFKWKIDAQLYNYAINKKNISNTIRTVYPFTHSMPRYREILIVKSKF